MGVEAGCCSGAQQAASTGGIAQYPEENASSENEGSPHLGIEKWPRKNASSQTVRSIECARDHASLFFQGRQARTFSQELPTYVSTYVLWGTVSQCVALLPHSKKVVGSSPASCNMSGLVPGPFCVEFACSPHVHLGSPHRTPQQQKHAKTNRCSSVLSLTRTGLGTWTWSPGAALLAAHCSWHSLGEDARMG